MQDLQAVFEPNNYIDRKYLCRLHVKITRFIAFCNIFYEILWHLLAMLLLMLDIFWAVFYHVHT